LVNNQAHLVFLSLFFFFGACSWSQGKWGDKEEGLIAISGTMASWKAFQFKPISWFTWMWNRCNRSCIPIIRRLQFWH